MRLSEEQYELIEAYLTDELSATDKASLERDMQTDVELRDEVNRQRDIRLGLRALGIEQALKQAQVNYKASLSAPVNAPKTEEQQPIVRPLMTWRYWAAAASVVIVLGVGYYAYQQSTSQQADLAYAETFAPDPTDELIKDFPSGNQSTTTRQQFLDALSNYKAGKYDEVIAQVATIPADKQTIYYKNYFLGLSYLANKQPSEAIPLLQKAMETPSATLRQKAEWFLALAFVKSKENKEALPILNRISSDKANPFHSLAQRVLQKVK